MTTKTAPPPGILLLGATGQVGRELLRTVGRLGPVTATARTSSELAGARTVIPLDVTDLDALRLTVRAARPSIIVNAAAYTAVDRAETETDLAATINGVVPGVLAEEACAMRRGIGTLFDRLRLRRRWHAPWRETDATNPLNAYGRTKLAGEEAIRASSAAQLILRISWIYAAHGHNFVRTMLKLGSERTELRVVADQIGAPTPAAQVAAATTEILELAAAAPAEFLRERGGTFHLPCAGETNWHGFAEEIFRLGHAAGLPLRVEHLLPITTADYPTPARRPQNSRLDGRLAEQGYGIRLPEWRAALAAEFPSIVAALREG